MTPPSGDDNVTLGEIARRLERFSSEIKASIALTVNKEVYDRDVAASDRRFQDLEDAVDALAKNRRQAVYAILAVCGAIAAAVIGALISSGAHL